MSAEGLLQTNLLRESLQNCCVSTTGKISPLPEFRPQNCCKNDFLSSSRKGKPFKFFQIFCTRQGLFPKNKFIQKSSVRHSSKTAI